ncbi:50S ribosomal protein L14e [Candidatus Woesearchaeota archaeon]|nr:50S ribosomal protein L14e [Candidatus Woesearchaeota archaeon]
MSLFTVGRLCVKTAGRDAGKECVVVEQLDNTYVLVDGGVRRKKVNLKHLEPLSEVVELKKGASHEEVTKLFSKLNLPVWDHNSKSVSERPKKQKKKSEENTGAKGKQAKEKGAEEKKAVEKKAVEKI